MICESVGTDFFPILFCSSLLKGGASHKDVDNIILEFTTNQGY